MSKCDVCYSRNLVLTPNESHEPYQGDNSSFLWEIILNWWKGKPSGSIACTRKQQPRFYWSCSSVVMNDATPLTPPSAWAEAIFKCKQHTCTLHDPWGPEQYLNYIKKWTNTENKHKNSLFWMSVTSCCSLCLFLYGQFCHGALKPNLSTLFETFFFEYHFNSSYKDSALKKFIFI